MEKVRRCRRKQMTHGKTRQTITNNMKHLRKAKKTEPFEFMLQNSDNRGKLLKHTTTERIDFEGERAT